MQWPTGSRFYSNTQLLRLYRLYGAGDNVEATQIDIVCEGLLDFSAGGNADDAAAQQKYFPRFERILASGGGYLVGTRLSFVDVMLFHVLSRGEAEGLLAAYPLLAAHRAMMRANERLAAYLADPAKRFPSPGRPGYMERVVGTIPWIRSGDPPGIANAAWRYRL